MLFPNFLKNFTTFNELMKERTITTKYTGERLELKENIFGEQTVILNGEFEYPITNNESKKDFYKEVVVPLVELFKEEEKYIIFNECMNLKQIEHYDSYQSFLNEGTYESEHDYEENNIRFLFETGNDLTQYDSNDIDFLIENEEKLFPWFQVETNGTWDEIFNWKMTPKQKMKIVTGVVKNPNGQLEDDLINYFEKEEALLTADYLDNSCSHYSDYENNKFAFNIKVYDSFVNEELYELGVLNDDDEWRHRNDAIESLVDDIENNSLLIEEGIEILNWHREGRSGGYLVLTLDDATVKALEKIDEIITEAKKESPIFHQSIDRYEGYDFVIETLEEKREEAIEEKDQEKVKNIEKLLKEVDIKIA